MEGGGSEGYGREALRTTPWSCVNLEEICPLINGEYVNIKMCTGIHVQCVYMYITVICCTPHGWDQEHGVTRGGSYIHVLF